jgi:hypothetical protein
VSAQSKVAANLQAFRIAVGAHDRENPPPHSPAHGIGLSGFDLGRLGFDDGEELWAGVRVQVDGKTTGNFRVLCDSSHADDNELVEAVAKAFDVSRELIEA